MIKHDPFKNILVFKGKKHLKIFVYGCQYASGRRMFIL